MNKLLVKYEDQTIAYDRKINHYFDQLRKIEIYLKDTNNELEVEGKDGLNQKMYGLLKQ